MRNRRRPPGLSPGRGEGVVDLAGRTSLKELAALLSLSAFHVGIDSAAPHIAAAVGTPTITIYGPTDWRDWAPEGERHRVIEPERDCVPCREKGCRGEGRSECLEDLGAGQVIGELEEFIRSLKTIARAYPEACCGVNEHDNR